MADGQSEQNTVNHSWLDTADFLLRLIGIPLLVLLMAILAAFGIVMSILGIFVWILSRHPEVLAGP